MKRYRAITAAIAAALIGSWASSASAADDAAADGARKIWVADYAGKPPFKRRAVSEAEFARFEETRTTILPTVGERLHVVDAKGRPPFRRQVVDIDANNAVEFARFEEVKPASSNERRRHGAPGKGFWR